MPHAAGHLLQVINDLLDMSKIEAGGVVIELVATDPALIVEDVASLMRVRAGSKGVELERAFEGALPRSVTTDAMRLRQIATTDLAKPIDRGLLLRTCALWTSGRLFGRA